MKKALFILFISVLLTLNYSYGQHLPSLAEKNDFIRWYVNYKTIIPRSDNKIFLSQSLANANEVNRIASVLKLSQIDKIYIKKQTHLLTKAILLDSNSLRLFGWKNDRNTHDKFITHFSNPIFSLNRKLAIIHWAVYCGDECGEEGIDVFIKNHYGKWKLSKIPTPIIMY